MQVSHLLENDICILILEGNFTHENMSQVTDYVTPILEEKDPKALMVDLKKVNIVDSFGMGVFVTLHSLMLEKRKQFACYHLNVNLEEQFETSSLDQVFGVYRTKEEALAGVNQPLKNRWEDW